MKCFMCKGDLEDKMTNFIADMENCIIIVKGVPSQVCKQCGEVSYSNEVAERLEKIVAKMKDAMTEIAVVHYSDKVALDMADKAAEEDDKRLTHEEVFSSFKRRTNDGKDNREEYSFL